MVSDLDRKTRDRGARWPRPPHRGALPARASLLDRLTIDVVSIDPYEAYRQAIRTELPWAQVVVDHFHLVRGANAALDAVRRERQREAGRRRPKGARLAGRQTWRQDLYRARDRPLKARERLTERDRRRLRQLFEREPPLCCSSCLQPEAATWLG